MAKCKDCKWSPGLDDESTLCASCNGSGEVNSKRVSKKEVPKLKENKSKRGKK